jgi:hypothetical protein
VVVSTLSGKSVFYIYRSLHHHFSEFLFTIYIYKFSLLQCYYYDSNFTLTFIYSLKFSSLVAFPRQEVRQFQPLLSCVLKNEETFELPLEELAGCFQQRRRYYYYCQTGSSIKQNINVCVNKQ